MVAAGCVATPPGIGEPSPTDRAISVSATGSATADPDLAIVRVSVEETAATADAARRRAAANATRTREAIRGLGVPDDDVRTSSFGITPIRDDRDSGEILRYSATHTFEVRADTDKAGAVIDAAIENGASRVDDVRFTLREDTRDEVRARALRDAMDRARADARGIATAAGVRVGSLQSASTADTGFVPVDARRELGDGGGATVLEPGPVTVTVSVQATYSIAR